MIFFARGLSSASVAGATGIVLSSGVPPALRLLGIPGRFRGLSFRGLGGRVLGFRGLGD